MPDARRVTREERDAQLREFAELCEHLGIAFADHEPLVTSSFRPLANRAWALLENGWEQPDLDRLGSDFPGPPVDWLNPKAPDYDRAREPWQEEVAQWYRRGWQVSVDLRATAVW